MTFSKGERKLVVRESEMPALDDICGKAVDLINPELSSSRGISIATILIDAGKSSERHLHNVTEEIYYIVAGLGEVTIGSETYQVAPGTAVYLPLGVPHQIRNTGITTLKLISADAPPFDPADIQK